MNRQALPFDTERLIRDYLAAKSVVATPPSILERSLGHTARASQRPASMGLPALLRSRRTLARSWTTAAIVPLVVAIAIGTVALAGLGLAPPSPAASATPSAPPSAPPATMGVVGFRVPFAYEPTAGLVPVAPLDASTCCGAPQGSPDDMVGWIGGAVGVEVAGRAFFGLQDAGSGVERGIVVAAAVAPWSHRCGDGRFVRMIRFPLRTAPRELLHDLEGAGIAPGDISPVQVAGYQGFAMTPDLAASRCQYDVHFVGDICCLGENAGRVSLAVPMRLLAVDVDGTTVVVQIWARTAADLEAFVPQAMAFVDGFDFQ